LIKLPVDRKCGFGASFCIGDLPSEKKENNPCTLQSDIIDNSWLTRDIGNLTEMGMNSFKAVE